MGGGGGQGGRGGATFRREPFVPRGGADGGDGGRGGSVTLGAADEVTDLSLYKRRSRWQADAGADGAATRKTGRNGSDVTLDVPVGTIALDSNGSLIVDLDRPGARAVVPTAGARPPRHPPLHTPP